MRSLDSRVTIECGGPSRDRAMSIVMRCVIALECISAGLFNAGCGDKKFEFTNPFAKKEAPPGVPTETAPKNDPSLRGSIRALAYVEGMRKILVRGYGVVGNLANTGGGDPPSVVREYLEREIRRRKSADDLVGLDAKEILGSKRFAAVEVRGEIPAAAKKGDHFDIRIEALGNQTLSLEDGVLYFCDLKLFQATPRGVIEGRTLCDAAGPVYVSPFGRDETSATKTNPRVGRVLGGGTVQEDRRLRLILNAPSYAMAVRIRDRLNGRFGASEPVADATQASTVRLMIPKEFRNDPRGFIDLVLHTYVDGDPSALQRRAGELAESIVHPAAAFEDISLSWEAIGRTVVPVIKRVYDNPLEAASYYSARAGLRLGDDVALEIVARHAHDPKSPFREQAVNELGRATRVGRSSDRLRMLLAADDSRIRIAAYEALRKRNDRAIKTVRVWDNNLILDLVDCEGPPLIYVQQSEQQRLAVFGRGTSINPPAEVDDGRKLVSITAQSGDAEVRVVRRNALHNKMSDPMPAPLQVAELVRFLGEKPVKLPNGGMNGLGLSYSTIVEVLDKLTTTQTIPGAMVFERPRVADTSARTVRHERPESEL